MQTELYTWDNLATSAGATTATLLIVQYIKLPLDAIPTRYVALAVALMILLASHALGSGGLIWSDVPLIVLNAFMVALSAMGAYEHTFKSSDEAKRTVAEQNPS